MRKMINFGPDPNDNGGGYDNEKRDPAFSRVRPTRNTNDLRDVLESEEEEERKERRLNGNGSREYFHDEEEEEDLRGSRWGWRDLLSEKGRKRLRTAEKVIAGVITGSKVLKSIKGMSRKQKVAVGAVLVAGAAGAAYLAMRKPKRRFL